MVVKPGSINTGEDNEDGHTVANPHLVKKKTSTMSEHDFYVIGVIDKNIPEDTDEHVLTHTTAPDGAIEEVSCVTTEDVDDICSI